ncbi:MAG: CDP-alcohol phosphatidyltransferase family protein [Verrucomicrobiota bacterium]|nr:CDP-alcohol phosphatidyltransferase family protein [Verrucomicrobiota bacterium]
MRLDAIDGFRQIAPRMEVVIFANAPEALTELCGVSLLERQLRILQRLGFEHAMIVSETPNEISAAIEPPTWARSGLATQIISRGELQMRERTLFLPGNIYCDARLIRSLTECAGECVLVDSNPPNELLPLLATAENDSRGFVSGAAVATNYDSLGDAAVIDAAKVPAYITGMRRTLRPVFFPAPSAELRPLAKTIVLDTGQNGTLDIPAIIQSPIETWVMRRLCRTSITPNQISFLNLVVALIAAAFFAAGYLWVGMIFALTIGVLDGLDGKQARIKIETTKAGKWESYLDLIYEISWWASLAFYFQRSGQLPYAWFYFLLIMAGEALDQLAKHTARQRIDRLLDDYSPFDRFVRLIAARRDVYLWSLAIALALGAAPLTYRLCAFWGLVSAGVHWLRAALIVARSKVAHPAR